MTSAGSREKGSKDTARALAELRSVCPQPLADHMTNASWSQLVEAYGAPVRAYHTLEHVCAVARWFERFRSQWRSPNEVFAAILYHDVVYEPLSSDNEARSMLVAREVLTRSPLEIAKVERMIELTASHGQLTGDMLSADEALFLDCDMAVLGAPASEYQRYAEGVRREYQAVPWELFRVKRAAFLRSLLAQDSVFFTKLMNARLGAAVAANLEWELRQLGGKVGRT